MFIETGIEIPSIQHTQSQPLYPFAKMEIGQSVFFEGCNSKSKERTAAAIYGMRHGKKFTARTMDGGLRIWRTA